MSKIDDENVIIASAVIALDDKPVLSLHDLKIHTYEISRTIGMKKFTPSNFERMFMPLTIPTLFKSKMINLVNGGAYSSHDDPDEITPKTICRLTEDTSKKMKNLRRGSKVKVKNIEQKEIFKNLDTIINGHVDEIGD
ncbi:MAG: hypothetical protein SCH39_11565 [Methanosarcinales archaeon]|nr:hypothetical protein [ANME-2 cluster archaeon]MDF1531782.1 hypothetical protein [ANME-2 cluster archaeon]MDW7776955.1 hypothetical protein [Methanosarcinales archaeon]